MYIFFFAYIYGFIRPKGNPTANGRSGVSENITVNPTYTHGSNTQRMFLTHTIGTHANHTIRTKKSKHAETVR